MISVATLAGGASAGYYTRAEGCGRELLQELAEPAAKARGVERTGEPVGYYVNDRELPGRWVGGGARALGLTGRLGVEDAAGLQELLEGRHQGEELVRPVWRRDDSGARVDVRRAGFDVTFSAPKSVSTLMALGDPAVVEQVLTAHRKAASEALGLLERLSARAARGHHGDGRRAARIDTDGFVAASFTHTTSRALDPQLHTHVVIANLAHGRDGRWSALDSRTLHREATTASYLYQHRLRAELTQRLGVTWTAVERGVAEIDGIPVGVRREFSTRRQQIEDALERAPDAKGRARQLAARAACLLTRPVKRHQPIAELRAQWHRRACAAGFGPGQLTELLAGPAREPVPVRMDEVLERVLAPDGVTRQAATFGQGTLLRELIGQLPPGAPVTTGELLGATAAAVRTSEVVPVVTADGHAYTTADLLRTETETLALATRADTILAQLDRQQAALVIARAPGLRAEQQHAAFTLLTRGLPVEVISGPAGCGKTAGLAVAAQAWRDAGIDVRGTVVAALTAQGLADASGAASVSLARALAAPDEHVPAAGVLLVDEAGMIGTRQLQRLLTLARARACKVVLVGDPQQLPELEAGGIFARLARDSAALTLHGHHRQREAWERDALQALRAGDISTALEAYRQNDRLHIRHDPSELAAAAVSAYLTSRDEQPDPWQTVLLASSREEVRSLNRSVREQLLATGRLGRRSLDVDAPDGTVDFRAGDQVMVTRNDHDRGLLNGTTATVTALHRDGLTVQTPSGKQVRVSRQWLEEGRLEHGYAMTLHKAQGRTVTTALLVGDELLSAQAGYVGLSRGTHANHLFIKTGNLHDLTTDCGAAVQHRPRHAPERAGLLRRDVRQRLATDQLRQARGPVHNFDPDRPGTSRAS